MNPRLKALHSQLEALHKEGAELMASATLTDTQKERKAALKGEIAGVQQEIAEAKDLEQTLAESNQFLNGAQIASIATTMETAASPEDKFKQIKAMRRARAKFFTLAAESRAIGQEKAFRFGMFIMASLKNNQKARAYCAKNGIPLQIEQDNGSFYSLGQSEGVPEDGGVLVPPEFENEMIVLRELFGVFRRNARYSPMASETKSRARRKGGLTAYYVGEDAQISESKKGWDQVKLIAKKLAVLTRTSTELSEDAIIDMGDDLAGEIAYAFAKAEDDAGFNGDGTSTYGGIHGVRDRLATVYGSVAGVGLTLEAANGGWASITLADMEAVFGSLPQYAETPNVKWYCHKAFYATVMLRLMLAAGGVTAAEVAQGAPRRFMGVDVEISQIMPKTTAVTQIPVFLGDLALASDFGDRRATTIAMSSDFHFDTDEIAIRGTERFDINVHDVGNATDAGPIVGLLTAAA